MFKIISVAQYGKNEVSVFPNPGNGVLQFWLRRCRGGNFYFSEYTVGQILSINVQNNGQLDMTAFPSGVYYLRLTSSGQVIRLMKE
ncbi:MAG: T9SS type A sorting domain-containing protein [Saprospiraceae bacterium]|nr:T9SS type A sorting domain-containing protein [Saprospiraceae bacterium]